MKFSLVWFCAAFIILSIFAKNYIKPDYKSQGQAQNRESTLSVEEEEIDLSEPKELTEIKKFMDFYPDIEYQADYDEEVKDWKIQLTAQFFVNRDEKSAAEKALKKKAEFYWAGGRMLPKEQLANKNDFWVLQYNYSNKLRDPKTYTDEELARIRQFGSAENRKSDGGTPMYFFDFIYSAKSRPIIEDHIIRTRFLGKTTKVHERILPALKRVEAEICLAAGISVETLASADKMAKIDTKSDSLTAEQKEIRDFIVNLSSCDAYHWREIAETNRKSFHSYGIAIDLLPRRLAGRAIYWGWEKERSGDDWMLVPVKDRWMPPESVIKIFEDQGFIWGGYWIIFDNMHFEYHPELVGNM
ncbi:M15 family metallopeptidase [Treponema sp. C6A8]|uniref:M15 family metallopeptidase n=1 Tax=Treponema sp. C6A8 TaxID=1410609 RepID=UPI000487879F|nr:M15 family metallopeptidase [Treponema sp. C6A8]